MDCFLGTAIAFLFCPALETILARAEFALLFRFYFVDQGRDFIPSPFFDTDLN